MSQKLKACLCFGELLYQMQRKLIVLLIEVYFDLYLYSFNLKASKLNHMRLSHVCHNKIFIPLLHVNRNAILCETFKFLSVHECLTSILQINLLHFFVLLIFESLVHVLTADSQTNAKRSFLVVLKSLVILGALKIIVENKLILGHFDICRYLLIVYINYPGKFVHESQLKNCFAVLNSELSLFFPHEIQGLIQQTLQHQTIVMVFLDIHPFLVLRL